MSRHRSTAAVWFAGLFGGIVGAFGSTLLPADPATPPAHVVQPDLDALVAKLEGSIDRRLEQRIAELPQWTAPKTQPLEAGNLIQRTATREKGAGPAPTDVRLIETLRTAPTAEDRIRKLGLHTANSKELNRRLLFRTYGQVVADLGFPDKTYATLGTVRFKYTYRRASGNSGSIEITFLDGICVAVQ